MSKTKEQIEELLKKREQRVTEEKVEEVKAKINEEMTNVSYDVYYDNNKSMYVMAVIKYNPDEMKSYVEKIVPVSNRIIGKRFQLDKDNLKTLVLGKNR